MEVTVQSMRWPVVGTVAKPLIVFVVVAPLPKMVWAAAEPFEILTVPALLLSVPTEMLLAPDPVRVIPPVPG